MEVTHNAQRRTTPGWSYDHRSERRAYGASARRAQRALDTYPAFGQPAVVSQDDPVIPTPAELVDAFVHPPTILTVARRDELSDGRVRIVSHLELWPWRVVVRGVRANRFPTMPKHATRQPYEFDESSSELASGRVDIHEPDAAEVRAFRKESEWMTGWRLSDDVGTEYQLLGAGSGGSGGELWSEFHSEFHPRVPSDARVLSIHPPDDDAFPVALPT